MFRQFMTDTLCLNKPDGRVFGDIRACVSGKGVIAIEDVSLPIQVGTRSPAASKLVGGDLHR